MERAGTKTTDKQARVVAETIDRIMSGTLFGTPPQPALKSKQDKPDTIEGWHTAHGFAANGVPYAALLHQRHYGGAYRQVLDAAGKLRGDIVEDAVEALFAANQIPYVPTGAHNQGDIAARFNVEVKPAPDFVVFDYTDTLRAMLECKGANDGGTARTRRPDSVASGPNRFASVAFRS